MKTKNTKRYRTAKSLLRPIAKFLLDVSIPETERRALWDVLTALRGPDDGRVEVKRATTAVIRHKLLGKELPGYFAAVHPDHAESAEFRCSLDVTQHFVYHAKHAFRALGLSWDSLNTNI